MYVCGIHSEVSIHTARRVHYGGTLTMHMASYLQ